MAATFDEGGPLLQTAILCDRVLIEEGSGMISAIRFVDDILLHSRAVVRTEEGEEVIEDVRDILGPMSQMLTMLLVFRGFPREVEIPVVSIQLVLPNGDINTHPLMYQPTPIGLMSGENARIEVNLQLLYTGIHWFDITYGEKLLTRIPFNVRYQTTSRNEEWNGPGPVSKTAQSSDGSNEASVQQ